MGGVSDTMQDFSNLVGIRSREQEESVELSIILRTSFSVTGSKQENWGGVDVVRLSAKLKLSRPAGIEEQRLSILSLKKFKNDRANADGEQEVGRDLGILRLRRESMAFHSFFGFVLLSSITFLK